MTTMTPEPQHAKPARWTFWQGAFVVLLSAATLGTAGPAGFSVYQTSRDFARPYLGHEAWILPVALEAVFMVLFGWGIVLAWRKAADVPVRVLGSAAIAALSFAVQVDAANGSFSGILVRVAIVASFFVAGFTMKAAFMRLRGGKVRGDRVSLGEFLASPPRAVGLWRWKNAWAEPSADAARRRYLVLLYVIALAQSDPRVGKRLFRWRRRLPVTLRYELSTGLLPAAISAGGDGWQQAAGEHVTAQLALLDAPPPAVAPDTAPAHAQSEPESTPGARPETLPEARHRASPEARAEPALKLAASKSRSMTPSELEPHVAAMLEAYGDVSQVRVKRDLHVSTDKARNALRLAKRNRTVVQIGARS
jgi:hypothetical protein